MLQTTHLIPLASRASRRKSKPPERLLDYQVYGIRSSSRSGNRRIPGKNETLSEPFTSRRTSRSEALRTPTPSGTSMRPKRQKITDYMNRISTNAQSELNGDTRELGGSQLPSNGLNTPTEGSSPDRDGLLEASKLRHAQKPELTPSALCDSKYPWNNNPIAVAMWVVQKVQSARLMVSPAPTCGKSSRQASGSSTPRAIDASTNANGLSISENSENSGLGDGKSRTSQRLKKTDSFNYIGLNSEPRANARGIAETDAGEERSRVDSGSTRSFDQVLQHLVKEVSPKIKNLGSFAPGYGDTYFETKDKKRISLGKGAIAAGKLFFDVLPVLREPESSPKFQAAADALIQLIDAETSNSPRCLEAIDLMSQDQELLLGTNIITTHSCVSELFLDIDAPVRGPGEQHNNNNISPNPNGDEEINTTPRAVYKTNNDHSKHNLTVDSFFNSSETHNSSLPSPFANHSLSSQLSQPAPSSPHPTSTHPTSTHSTSTHLTSTHLTSSHLTSTHPTSAQLASSSSSLPTQLNKNYSSLSVPSRNQSPVRCSSCSSLQTPPDNQSNSCSIPVQEHGSVYPSSFNSSFQTTPDKNSEAYSRALVVSSSNNTREKRGLICSTPNQTLRSTQTSSIPLKKHHLVNTEPITDPSSSYPHLSSLKDTPDKHSLVCSTPIQEHSSTEPSSKTNREKHHLVNTGQVTDHSSSHPPYHFPLKNTLEEHAPVSSTLIRDYRLTHPYSDSSLQTPSHTNWPAEPLFTSDFSLLKGPDKQSVIPSSTKFTSRPHSPSNTTPKHSLVSPTKVTDHSSGYPPLHPSPHDTLEKHSLVNSPLRNTYSTHHTSLKIPNLVKFRSTRDRTSTRSPPLNSSLLKNVENKTTPHDNTPPSRNQEPSSPSESTEKMVRASTRTRKPTERALEAAATAAASRRTAKKPAPKKAAAAPAKGEAGTKSSKDEVLVARLLELASAAVAPGFTPEQEVNVDELRKEFYDNLARREHGQGSEAAGRASTSVGSGVSGGPAVLDHPTIDRPWTDADGWTHTGQLNEHGEEFVLVPNTYVWYRPNNTFNDPLLPPPRPRMKSVAQIEKDRVFGFPPLLGERNLPVGDPRPRKRSREDMEAGQRPPADEDGGPRKKPKTAPADPDPAPAATTTTTAASNSTPAEDLNSDPAPTSAPPPAPDTTNATVSKRGARSRAPKKERPAPSRASARTRAARGAKKDNV